MEFKNEFLKEHKNETMTVQDSMDVLYGKWKIAIISSICYYNKRRFSDILNDVTRISNKMLSKELKELGVNKLILWFLHSVTPTRQHSWRWNPPPRL